MPRAPLDLSALRSTGEHLLPMGDGHMQVVVNAAAHGAPRGIALIAHPHPLLGGSAKHKVPHALATALAEAFDIQRLLTQQQAQAVAAVQLGR